MAAGENVMRLIPVVPAVSTAVSIPFDNCLTPNLVQSLDLGIPARFRAHNFAWFQTKPILSSMLRNPPSYDCAFPSPNRTHRPAHLPTPCAVRRPIFAENVFVEPDQNGSIISAPPTTKQAPILSNSSQGIFANTVTPNPFVL